MQDHGSISRIKLILDGWGQSYREKICLCGNSRGCLKGTDIGEGSFW